MNFLVFQKNRLFGTLLILRLNMGGGGGVRPVNHIKCASVFLDGK